MTKEEAKEIIFDQWQSFLEDNIDYAGISEAYKMAISALSENKSEWIPASERLPDNNVRVLCCAISTSISGGYTRFVGCCNNGFWFVQTSAETVSYPRQYEVTAWMPLPEPYKAEKEVSE